MRYVRPLEPPACVRKFRRICIAFFPGSLPGSRIRSSSHLGLMGSKRPRPWSRQASGSSGSVAVAAAAFALAALSLPEAGALSGSCATGRSESSNRTRRWGDSSGDTTCIPGRRDGPGRRRKARLVLSSSGGASGHVRAPSSRSTGSGHVRSVLRQSSPPSVLPLAGDHEDGSERNGSRGGVGLREGSVPPPIPAISVAHVLEPPPRSPGSRRTPRPPASASTKATNSSSSSSSAHKSKAIKKVHRWKSDNDVRMFLMERGLSQWEVRKVLPVMRRDPELVNDVATLAARMQVICCVVTKTEENREWGVANSLILPCSLGFEVDG